MTSAKDVRSIDEVFRDVAAVEEASLVIVYEQRDKGFYSVREDLGHSFWSAIL